jgi:hypothetical protein
MTGEVAVAQREVVIHFELTETHTGIWCDTCNLPSAVRFDINTISERGVGTIPGVAACCDCGRWWP